MNFFEQFGIGANNAPDADEFEARLAEKGVPEKGVYQVILEEAQEPNEKTNGWALVFKIIAGPESGKKVRSVVWLKNGTDQDVTAEKRAMLYGSRLGMLVRNGAGKLVPDPAKPTFQHVIGAVTFVEVDHKSREYKNDKGNMVQVKDAIVADYGFAVLKSDDKKCQGVPTAASGVAQAAAAGAKANAAANPRTTQQTFANL